MQKNIRIAPSLLAADFANLASQVKAVEQAGADLLHLDVMDGHFVPNISFGPALIKALKSHTRLPFDCHLMIAPCAPFLPDFADAGADIITVHAEAGPHAHRSIQLIKSMGLKAGLALNPGTPVEMAEVLLPDLDLLLVMTVNPGFGGQAFIESQLEKVAILRAMIDDHEDRGGQPIDLEVDGGVNADTAKLCIQAGADLLVAGSAVFKGGQNQFSTQIRGLRP